MYKRVAAGVGMTIGIGLVAIALNIPLALGQVSAESQPGFAACRSAATFRLPDVNWSQALAYFTGYDSYGRSVFLWSLPFSGYSGTCVAGRDGLAYVFTVTSNPSFQSGPGVPATDAQYAACRVQANSILPGLTWGQLSVSPTAYPHLNGNWSIPWRGPGGVPSGTCVISSEGIVTDFNIN